MNASLKKHIVPLNMNGLKGRMLKLPPSEPGKKREILLVYGHHASIERMLGFAEELSKYGSVTMPDLPGFGGMDSFYTIGMKPTLDNLADYLAAFVKLRYKRKKVTIGGMSFGFVVITRMLQRYPELTNKVDILISIVGFSHKDDFAFTPMRYRFYRYGASFFSNRLPAAFFKNVVLHPVIIKTAYTKTYNAKKKFAGLSVEERKKATDFEVYLWRCNDVRTYMDTSVTFLTLDNCHKQINLPLVHISVSADQYFNNAIVEQHLNIIFDKVTDIRVDMTNHAPSIIASAKDAAPMIPRRLRNMLAKEPS